MGVTPEQQRRLFNFKRKAVRTPAERAMCRLLDRLHLKYIEQKGFMVGLKTFVIADFYLPRPNRLVIEVDGEYHKDQRSYDKFKDSYYISRGFKVYRAENSKVLGCPDLVIKDLKRILSIPH